MTGIVRYGYAVVHGKSPVSCCIHFAMRTVARVCVASGTRPRPKRDVPELAAKIVRLSTTGAGKRRQTSIRYPTPNMRPQRTEATT